MKSIVCFSVLIILNVSFISPNKINGIWVPQKIVWPGKSSPYYKTQAFRTYVFKDNIMYMFVSTQRKHNYLNNVKDSLIFEGEPGYEFYSGTYQVKGDSITLNYRRIISSIKNPKQCIFKEIVFFKNNRLVINNIAFYKTNMYDFKSQLDMQDYIDLLKDSASCVNCQCK